MFAVLFSKSLDTFYQIIASFPTAIFTVLLALIVIYWLGTLLGVFDLDVLTPDLEGMDLNADSPHTSSDVLSALMIRMGLIGVPAMISLSFTVLFGWLVCFYAVYFLFGYLPGGWLRYIAGIPVLFIAFYLGMLITSVVIRPLKPLFRTSMSEVGTELFGRRAVVRTSRVDQEFGEAVVEDGGAGLILKVRSTGKERFAQGDTVILFDRIEDGAAWQVISEEEFAKSP